MTGVSYHGTVNDLQGLNWSNASPFARPEWFALLEKTAASPLYALAREGDDAVAMPLQFGAKQIEPLSNWYAFTWSPMHTGDEAKPHLLRSLADALANRSQRVVMNKLPDDMDELDRLQDAFRSRGWATFREPCDTNHILHLGGRDYARYLADRPGPLRTTLKRKAKKVDVALSDCFDAGDWADYEAIYAESWKPEEGDPALLQSFAEMESKAGRYRFAIARHEGEPVAAQFWTVDGDTAYIHKLAHREDAKALSPGTTLTAALMQRVIDTDGVQTVDFGTGDDAYKRDWMETRRIRWQLSCYRPGAPRNWLPIAKATIRKLVSPKTAG